MGGRGEGGLLHRLYVCRQPLCLGLCCLGGAQEGSRLQKGVVKKSGVARGPECPPSSPPTFSSGVASGEDRKLRDDTREMHDQCFDEYH